MWTALEALEGENMQNKYSGFLMSPEPIWCLLVEWLFHNTLSEIQLTSSSPSCGNIYLRRGGEFLKFLLRFCRHALPWASIWVRRGVASKFLEIEAVNKLSSEILRFSSSTRRSRLLRVYDGTWLNHVLLSYMAPGEGFVVRCWLRGVVK